MHHKSSKLRYLMLAFVFAALLLAPLGATAAPSMVDLTERMPPEDYDPISYEEIGPRLQEIAKDSNRVRFEVIGQSAGGRDLYLVTLSDPKAMGRLGHYQKIRKLMLEDPEAAQELIEKNPDFKVPIFINASIHGDEKHGVDAALQLIHTLAYRDSDEVQAILENVILLVNVVANPDGRVANTRSNANGFDLNRDFITQSQPETRAMVKVITEWNPMVLLDLHGYYYPMLLEPCTPLHNPNYEYDLYIKWALDEAEAMEAELFDQTGFKAQIPFRDDPSGWDDWAPTYTPMYAMFHGAYGHTLETAYQDQRGVAAHYAAVWGALKFAAENRVGMVYDQIEIFRRGFLDLPQMRISDEWLELNGIEFDQYQDLITMEFPAAYIIPASAQFQLSTHQTARLVDFLLANDVKVEQATDDFHYAGEDYPKGTYIVWMDQPKRGLANTILESGPDLSDLEGISFYSPPSVWSNLLLWGASGVVVEEDFPVNEVPDTIPISAADELQGSVETGEAYYAFQPLNLNAFRVANNLLASGVTLHRAQQAFQDSGREFRVGTFIIETNDSKLVSDLANRFGLEFLALGGLPWQAVQLSIPNLGIIADEGTAHALLTMGFKFDQISQGDLNNGQLEKYDVFVNLSASWSSLEKNARGSFYNFIDDGGDYIGLKGGGVDFAIGAGIIDAEADSSSGNAIVAVDFTENDSISAGFGDTGFGFVYTPVWFTETADDIITSVTLAGSDFLVSGYWPGWDESGAADMPVVIHKTITNVNGPESEITLIGLDTTFRGHPENTFRLIGNAIFSGAGSE